jgi:hypothetical protein
MSHSNLLLLLTARSSTLPFKVLARPQDHSGPRSPPIQDGADFDHHLVEKRESIDEDGFDAEYDDLMYQTASREELIRRLKEQSVELERLRAQLRQQHK